MSTITVRTLMTLSLLVFAGSILFPDQAKAMLEDHFLFFPERQIYATPAIFDLEYQDVHFTAEDATEIHGWYLPGDFQKPLVLFFHGNAGNISHRLDNLKLLRKLGLSIFIFDYRGYGKSQGKTSEEGTYSDARGALQYLKQQGWDTDQMIYFGRSMGAGVALQLALEEPPAALVLESPFTSVTAMGRYHYPLLSLLAGWLIQARYDNLEKIDKIKTPLLIFQGGKDAIVPPEMAEQLYNKARKPKQLIMLPAAGHNDTYEVGGSFYWQQWSLLINKLTK